MVALVKRYFPELTEAQLQTLSRLQPIYEEWNQKINVISRKDIDQFEERHLLHSLGLTFYWQPKSGQKILDIGTGGGFPGIPLAILYPEVDFVLIDSIAKKTKVVNEVSQELNLKNVKAIQSRAENIEGSFDMVISRAVARLNVLVEYCAHSNIQTPELLCLKGGDLRNEQEEVDQYPSVIYNLSNRLKGSFFETKKVVRVIF